MSKEDAGLKELVDITERLRAPDGCPWDRKQTLQTIKDYLVEECAEAYEAASREDWDDLAEELGDVMFEVVFMAQFAKEKGKFDVNAPLAIVKDKLIRRHPHVFGDASVKDAEEVLKNWHKIKAEERNASEAKREKSELDGVPRSLPALLQANRMSSRAAALGFDWNEADDVLTKAEEEIAELRESLKNPADKKRIEEELGDLLFALANFARKADVSAQDALLGACDKFRRRFGRMEAIARKSGENISSLDMLRLEALWDEAKAEEKKPK